MLSYDILHRVFVLRRLVGIMFCVVGGESGGGKRRGRIFLKTGLYFLKIVFTSPTIPARSAVRLSFVCHTRALWSTNFDAVSRAHL